MAKHFTFADRFVPVQFFDDENPVKITMKISDHTDAKILAASKAFADAESIHDMDNRRKAFRAALDDFIGAENAEKILSRADDADCFAIYSVYKYLLSAYGEAKAKNLSASVQ